MLCFIALLNRGWYFVGLVCMRKRHPFWKFKRNLKGNIEEIKKQTSRRSFFQEIILINIFEELKKGLYEFPYIATQHF